MCHSGLREGHESSLSPPSENGDLPHLGEAGADQRIQLWFHEVPPGHSMPLLRDKSEGVQVWQQEEMAQV